MKRMKFFLLLPLIFSSSCEEISSVFSKEESKEELKEEVKEETLSKEEIEDLIKKSEVFSREEALRIFNLLIREYYSKEEILEIIKDALKDTYTTSEVDHLINSLEGERVVESYRSNYSWYRIYSDNWIEQGGRNSIDEVSSKEISLHKEMSDTNYSIQILNNSSHTSKNAEGVLTAVISTTKKIKVTAGYLDPNTVNFFWEVKGFINPKEVQEVENNEIN